MNTKTDITDYSEDELTLIVMNDYNLYKMRKSLLKDHSILDEYFIYTEEQLDLILKRNSYYKNENKPIPTHNIWVLYTGIFNAKNDIDFCLAWYKPETKES